MESKLYLNKKLEFSKNEIHNDELFAVAELVGYEHFGNNHTSFSIRDKDGKELCVNNWYIKELYINEQWSKSYIMRLIVYKSELVPAIDLCAIVSKDAPEWYNRYYNSSVNMYSKMFQHCVAVLEKIPSKLMSLSAISLYQSLIDCTNMVMLAKFYPKLIKNRINLNNEEISVIETLFLEKMNLFLDIKENSK